MRDTQGAGQVRGLVVHDQVVGIDAVGRRAIAQRAEVNLLERGAAKAQQKQHAVCVGVVLSRRRRQVVVHVLFESVSQLVTLQRRAVSVVPDLDGPVGRQKLRPGVGLEAQHGFLQQWVPNLGHAFDRCAVRCALHAGKLDLQAQQLDALSPVVDPLGAAVQIVLHAAHKVFGDAGQFVFFKLFGEVVEPALWPLLPLRIFDGLAVQRYGYRPVAVVNTQDGTISVELGDIDVFVRVFHGDVHGGDSSLFRLLLQSDVW